MPTLQRFHASRALIGILLVGACSNSPESPLSNPTLADIQGVWVVSYRRVVTKEATPQIFDTRSFATCSATTPPPCAIRPLYFVLDSGSQQYAFATQPPSDSGYSPLLLGSAVLIQDSLALGATVIGCCQDAATYGLQAYSSRMHLLRNWTLGGVDAQRLGFTLPAGTSSLDATEEWWLQR